MMTDDQAQAIRERTTATLLRKRPYLEGGISSDKLKTQEILEYMAAEREYRDQVATTDIPALLADREERVRLLRAIEWAPDSTSAYRHCPWCQNAQPQGHHEDCQLARFLA